MNDAVFISDLHLSPNEPEITDEFVNFCQWASHETQSLYILGDFFHLWIGDDDHQEWLYPIIDALRTLHQKGVKTYFMAGNRDFLLGTKFCQQARLTYLPDPSVVLFDGQRVVLTHGDKLCTKDKWHQWFYRLTRNRIFRTIFTTLPLSFRQKMAYGVRRRSQENKPNQKRIGDVTLQGLMRLCRQYPTMQVIHGHTHQPALHRQLINNKVIHRYVLSDWDDRKSVLCYSKAKGYYFYHF